LATTDDARVHCAVLKIRAVPARTSASAAGRTGPDEGRQYARSLRTQQRARPGRHRHHPSTPEGVLTGLSDELTE
jgi:hypothetical protein